MPIFGDTFGSTIFGSRSMPMPIMGSDAIGSSNPFLFNPIRKKPVATKPGAGFGFNGQPGVATAQAQAPAPNYGPLASGFSQLFTPPTPQTANPFQYF